MRKTRVLALTVFTLATTVVSSLGVTSSAFADAGDGTCSSTELCVYRNFDRHKSEGYFDLGGQDTNFTNGNNNWINASGNLNDAISSYTAGTGTSCTGYSLFWDKDYRGNKFNIPKGWGGNIAGAYANHNNEASSYSKYGC
ncbi:hypothetical protein [Streptomyces sp. NPDC055287]